MPSVEHLLIDLIEESEWEFELCNLFDEDFTFPEHGEMVVESFKRRCRILKGLGREVDF